MAFSLFVQLVDMQLLGKLAALAVPHHVRQDVPNSRAELEAVAAAR
jgi:hypothetical protein